MELFKNSRLPLKNEQKEHHDFNKNQAQIGNKNQHMFI